METLNLCEILKGHEGKTFYSRCFGPLKFIKINNKGNTIELKSEVYAGDTYMFWSDGKYSVVGEIDLFPSKDQRDWNKWLEEQKSKVPKTWSEMVAQDKETICIVEIDEMAVTTAKTPIEKSALALLKIHQLIEVGYGGNVTNEDWKNPYLAKYDIIPDTAHSDKLCVRCVGFVKSVIAFHTKEQAEEFLKYPENVQLLKDYFMI